mmetsp:Transcript_15592/g.23586  ORF Transcript_15592/g.23586 Transcript_15592/m.23586 type:complete len:80 (-) Transcript_15592:200-439(-)
MSSQLELAEVNEVTKARALSAEDYCLRCFSGNTCMLEETNDIGNTTAPVPTPAPSSAALASVSIMICIISISSAINCIA